MMTTDERLTAIEVSTALTASHVTDIRARLFGNGQPGVITTIEQRVGLLERVIPTDFADRLRMMEFGLIISLILAGGLKVLDLLKLL